ncbi:MAG: CDP-alcohol phosphatidyltransferase family protein [Hyphomicrobiales bacterium]|nr:CDP-alcohol phosphatidyltransferase family protein [Hyphomicrobiales bacterium]
MSVSNPRRHNRSFLAANEQSLIRWILPRLPAQVKSLHLTAIGLVGSVAAAFALVACNWTPLWLIVVALGVAINWFGDSLDGSLARYRQEERPRFGFLVDHTCDLVSQLLIIVAFGFSPYLSLVSALTILLCYLLFSAYTYIRAATQHVHQMSYIGVGATEFRILMIVWPVTAAAFGVHEPLVSGLSKIDFVILALAFMAICGLLGKAVLDAVEIARDEQTALAAARADAEADVEAQVEPLATR